MTTPLVNLLFLTEEIILNQKIIVVVNSTDFDEITQDCKNINPENGQMMFIYHSIKIQQMFHRYGNQLGKYRQSSESLLDPF